MLRPSVRTTVSPEGVEVSKPLTHEELLEERLDLIIGYLERAERRERWGAIGTVIRTVITLLPFLLFLGSLWYVAVHGQDIINQIATQAGKQAGAYSQNSMNGFMDQFRGFVTGGSRSSSSSSTR